MASVSTVDTMSTSSVSALFVHHISWTQEPPAALLDSKFPAAKTTYCPGKSVGQEAGTAAHARGCSKFWMFPHRTDLATGGGCHGHHPRTPLALQTSTHHRLEVHVNSQVEC